MMTRVSVIRGANAIRACAAGAVLVGVWRAGGASSDLPPPVWTNTAVAQSGQLHGLGVARPAVWTVSPTGTGMASVRSFTVQIDGFSVTTTQAGATLHIPGAVSAPDKGAPAIPRLARLFPGVPGCTAALQVRGIAPVEATNIAVAAAEEYIVVNEELTSRRLSPVRRPALEINARDEFWPPDLGRVQEAWIGTQKVVRIECCPIQYNPVRRTVRWYRRLEGTLTFKSGENATHP